MDAEVEQAAQLVAAIFRNGLQGVVKLVTGNLYAALAGIIKLTRAETMLRGFCGPGRWLLPCANLSTINPTPRLASRFC